MNVLFGQCDRLLLWAQRHRLDDVVGNMGTGFRDARSSWSTDDLIKIGVVLLVGAVVAFGLARLASWGWRRFRHSSLWLFCALCQAHRLKWKDRWLLWQLARQSGLREAGLLFVDPRLYAADRLPPALTPARERLAELQARLFLDPDSEQAKVRVFPSAAAEPSAAPPATSATLFSGQDPPIPEPDLQTPPPAPRSPLPPAVAVPQVGGLPWGAGDLSAVMPPPGLVTDLADLSRPG